MRSEPAAAPKVPRPSVRPAKIPTDGEHTAIFHVTAELLEHARRVRGQSDAPAAPEVDRVQTDASREDRTLAFSITNEMLEETNRTVTFQVPQELLAQARRMFEPDEDAPQSIAPGSQDAQGESTSMAPVASRETLLQDLGSKAASRAELGSRGLADDEDDTALWNPQELDESSNFRSPMAPQHQRPQAKATPASFGWLWGLFLCLVVVLALTLLKRIVFR